MILNLGDPTKTSGIQQKPRGSNKNLGDPTKTSGIQQKPRGSNKESRPYTHGLMLKKLSSATFGRFFQNLQSREDFGASRKQNLKNRLIFIFVSQEFAHKLDVRKPRSLEANDGFFLMLRDQTMGKDGPSARECSLAKSKLPYSWSCLV